MSAYVLNISQSIVSYDAANDKMTKLYDRADCSNQKTGMMIYENYLYFYASRFEENENKEKILISDVYAIDIKSGKSFSVLTYEDSVHDVFIGGDSGRIYFADPVGGIFSIPAGKSNCEKEYLYKFDGDELLNWNVERMALYAGHIYYYTTDPAAKTTSFWRLPLSGGVPEVFFTAELLTDFCYYTENYIYYSSFDQVSIGKCEDMDVMKNIVDIKRVGYDGKNAEDVFRDFGEGKETYSMMNIYMVIGNYIYTQTHDWGEEIKDIYEPGDCKYNGENKEAISRIDITTGELTYLK